MVLQIKKCDDRFILSSVLVFIAIFIFLAPFSLPFSLQKKSFHCHYFKICIIASVCQNEIANINSFRFVSDSCLKVLKATDDADIATVCKNCMEHHKTIKAKLKRKENRLVKMPNILVTKYTPISKVSRED